MASQSNTTHPPPCCTFVTVNNIWLEILEKQKCSEIHPGNVENHLSRTDFYSQRLVSTSSQLILLRLNKVKVCLSFLGHIWQRETSFLERDLVPSRRTQTGAHNIISELWNRSACSCYSEDRLFLTPVGPLVRAVSDQRGSSILRRGVSQCHVARKWHIIAADHAAVRGNSSDLSGLPLEHTCGKRLWCLSALYSVYRVQSDLPIHFFWAFRKTGRFNGDRNNLTGFLAGGD